MTRSFLATTLSVSTLALTSVFSFQALAQEHKEAAKPAKAVAVLQSTSGSKVKGTITFTKSAEGVLIQGEVSGLTPGKHGFHIHEFGDITSADGKSAGGHFNPEAQQHGGPDNEHRHAGDFGNIEAGADGVAKINITDKHVSFDGEKSIIGRGVVVHAKADDLKSQPAGDAGDRIAVGVIGLTK